MFSLIIRHIFSTGFPVVLCFVMLIVAGCLTSWLVNNKEE